jgi:S1-C subfamily serine protease
MKPSKLRGALAWGQFITVEGDVVGVNWGNIAAMGALLLALGSSMYKLTIVPFQEDMSRRADEHERVLIEHEVRIRAGEISDSATGVHLQNLTKSIDRLIAGMQERDRNAKRGY